MRRGQGCKDPLLGGAENDRVNARGDGFANSASRDEKDAALHIEEFA
jgi:hypothetical protein